MTSAGHATKLQLSTDPWWLISARVRGSNGDVRVVQKKIQAARKAEAVQTFSALVGPEFRVVNVLRIWETTAPPQNFPRPRLNYATFGREPIAQAERLFGVRLPADG